MQHPTCPKVETNENWIVVVQYYSSYSFKSGLTVCSWVSLDRSYLKSISYNKMASRNGKSRLTLIKRQSFSYWLQIIYVKSEQQKIGYFLRICTCDWRASIALQYNFHIHFMRKSLIIIIFVVIFEVLNVEN